MVLETHAGLTPCPLETFSTATHNHGCIRVERPVDLAVFTLEQKPEWTRQRTEEAMDGSAQQHVDLEDPIPVHIVYWTAYVDDNGTVQFRADLYERLDGSAT